MTCFLKAIMVMIVAASVDHSLAADSSPILSFHRTFMLNKNSIVNEKINIDRPSTENLRLVVEDFRPDGERAKPGEIFLNGVSILKLGSSGQRPTFVEVEAQLKKGLNILGVELKPSDSGFVAISMVSNQLTSQTKMIGSSGGTIEIVGVAKLIIPPKAFSSSTRISMIVSRTSETSNDYFSTVTAYSSQGPRLPYEIKIQTGKAKSKLPLKLTVEFPKDFLAGKSVKLTPRMYGQMYFSGENEVLDQFEKIESIFDSKVNHLSVSIQPDVFTDVRNTARTEEAILVPAVVFGQ